MHAWRMYMSGVRLTDGIRQLRAAHTEYEQMILQYPTRKTLERALAETVMSPYVESADIGGFMEHHGFGLDHWRIGLIFWWMWRRGIVDEALGTAGKTSAAPP
jgi:hypothetical protein